MSSPGESPETPESSAPVDPPEPVDPVLLVGPESLADGEWHRLHPASPLLRGGIFLVAVIGFLFANLRERLIDLFLGVRNLGGDPIDEIYRYGAIGWALLGLFGVLVVIVTGFYLSWRMHTFRINAEVVEVRSGILFRSNRRARLDRVQGVNILRPLLPRLFGTARLEVSVAGQDANVQLDYLSSTLADGLRHDILYLASAAPGGSPAVLQPVAGAEPAEESSNENAAPLSGPGAEAASLVRIPTGRLFGSILLSPATLVLLLVLSLMLWGSLGNGAEWPLVLLVPGALAVGGYYLSRFNRSLRYSIVPTGDGVRLGFGMFSTSSETLPPGRIHAVSAFQPVLWRPFGWWRVRINTAGNSSSNQSGGLSRLMTLPVGTRDDVLAVLRLLLPGPDLTQDDIISYGLAAAAEDPKDPYRTAPWRAAWLRPFSWRRTGWVLRSGVALFRRGVFARELVLVPLARVQSVALHQGPVLRRLRLRAVRLHTVSGPVIASLDVIDSREAVQLFERLAQGAVECALAETPVPLRATEIQGDPE